MEIYIHVPFCKQKCHYCGFYSEPLGVALHHNQKSEEDNIHHSVSQETSISLGLENNEQSVLLPSDIGINLFSAQKKKSHQTIHEELIRNIIQGKFEGENVQGLAENFVRHSAGSAQIYEQNPIITHRRAKKKKVEQKEKLLNSSKAFGTHPVGVQSLADILKSRKTTHITEKQKQKIKGTTLGDALLSKEQAHNLRKSFGLPDLDLPEDTDKNEAENNTSSQNLQEDGLIKKTSTQKVASLAALLMPSAHEKQSFSVSKNIEQNRLETKAQPHFSQNTLQSVKSLIAGDSKGFVDMETANNYVRIAKSGENIHQEEIQSMSVPRALPESFIDKNALVDNAYYQLWKKTLLSEIKIYARNYKKEYTNEAVTSIFFGGGTPSYIPVRDINMILRTIIRNFPVTRKAEITLEANPESITLEKARAYLHSGINRVSLGVQSLQDTNLQTLGRAHSAISAIKAFHILREARFNNISIDLMWGLPNQKNRNWRADIKEAINLAPEHISCYGLSIDDDTYFSELEEQGELVLPEEKEQALMYRSCVDLLEEAGYLQYEISNFAKMGYSCQHNMGYWQGENYLGFGPSAASTVYGIRQTHARSLVDWAKDVQFGHVRSDNFFHNFQSAIEHRQDDQNQENLHMSSLLQNNQVPYFTKEILSKQETVLECIMLRLRTTKGLSFEEYKKLTNRSFMSDHKSLIQTLIQKNLVRVKNGNLSLSSSGMLISNSILELFFERTKKILQK